MSDGPDDLPARIRQLTQARVFLPRAGVSLTTRSVLEQRLAAARARDAVHQALDVGHLVETLRARGRTPLVVRSAAETRAIYLVRPDLGRQLSAESARVLAAHAGSFDLALVVADGLSARATASSAIAVLDALLPLVEHRGVRVAPIVVAEQARVILGDPIAAALGARAVAILLGERPGSTAADGRAIYSAYQPGPATTEAERNCLSNVRPGGQTPALAAHKLAYLIEQSFALGRSGLSLKEAASPSRQLPPSLRVAGDP